MPRPIPRPCLSCARWTGADCFALLEVRENCSFRDDNHNRVACQLEEGAEYLNTHGAPDIAKSLRTLARRVRDRGRALESYGRLTEKGA